MRLDKFLTEMGFGSRSAVKEMAKKGRITVNGIPVKASDYKINEESDIVAADGQAIVYQTMEYYMLNKPAGIITATQDKRAKTVLDLLEGRKRSGLFPVGRLDKDTEGLLLITNDGDLAHRLLSPKKHVDKTYYARIGGIVTQEHVKRFAAGLTLQDKTEVMPGKLVILSVDTKQGLSEIRLSIREGKFHQIKRMFETVGMKVLYLKRLSMGPLALDKNLKPGQYRPLTKEEVRILNEAVGREGTKADEL